MYVTPKCPDRLKSGTQMGQKQVAEKFLRKIKHPQNSKHDAARASKGHAFESDTRGCERLIASERRCHSTPATPAAQQGYQHSKMACVHDS